MTHTNNLTAQPINYPALVNRALIGGGIGLVIISLFVFGVRNPNPTWGKFWMVQPLIVTPVVGAIGGACHHLANHYLGSYGGWIKTAVMVLSVIGFVIALWMGIVLGLANTMWD